MDIIRDVQVREWESYAPQRKFQIMEEGVSKLLDPGQEIDEDDFRNLGNLGVLIVGNNNLRPDQLQLRNADVQSIGNLQYPGKSGILDFVPVDAHGFTITESEKEIVTQRTVGKHTDRHDGIYISKVPVLNRLGFKLFYAPVRTNGLHVRIVYEPYTEIEYPAYNIAPIPERALERLQSGFLKLGIGR